MKTDRNFFRYFLALAITLSALLIWPVTKMTASSALLQGGQGTITQPINIGAGERTIVRFDVFTPGTITARVNWQGTAQRLALILNGPRRTDLPNPVAFYARNDGASPLAIQYTVTAEDIRRGISWRVSVVNFETGSAQGQLTVSFPDQVPAGTPAPIRLQTISLLPSAEAINAFKTALQQTSAPGLHGVIQFSQLPNAAQRRTLENSGIKLLTFLNNKAYFASVSKQAVLDNIQNAPSITFLSQLNPEDKIQLDLLESNFGRFVVKLEDGKTVNYVLNADGSVNVTVVFYADARREDRDTLLRSIATSSRKLSETNFVVTVKPDQLMTLASNDIVKWIDAGPVPFLPENNRTRRAIGVEQLQAFNTTTCTYNLDGSGIQVGIYDSGVDQAHNDFFALNGCNLTATSRIISSTAAIGSHGTHVAGIVAASGFQSNQNNSSSMPNGGAPFQWRGMAPRAELIERSSGDTTDLDNLYQAIVNFGLDVSNHSYAVEPDGVYGTDTQTRDQSIRGDSVFVDASNNSLGIPARLQVYSAGNGGAGAQYGNQQGYFALTKGMKNAVIVGNWNVVNPNNPTTILTGGRLSNDSSLGPTYDGRIKPDLVAPGSGITSTGDGTNGYFTTGGTSMASPVIAGTVALILQAFGTQPLPSTLRAVLAHTATDIVGNDIVGGGFNNPDINAPVAAFVGPDFATGYGLVNASAAVELIQETPGNIIEDEITGTCDKKMRTFNVVAGLPQLKITLAWDDPEGDPNSASTDTKLVNDLDLVLVDPNGVKHYPWLLNQTPSIANDLQQCGDTITVTRALTPTNNPAAMNDPIAAGDFVAAGNGRDHLNNLEQVVVNTPVAGMWTIMVEGFGVPLGPQRFSLVVAEPLDADLSISKTASPNPVVTGTNVTYTITVTNNGPDTAPSVVVTDNLPASTTFVSCMFSGGTNGMCAGSGNNRTITFDSLAPSTSATITLVANVSCALADGTPISNSASVTSAANDPNPANNASLVMVMASNPPPVITCPSSRDVVTPLPGMMTANVTYPAPVVVDNCPGAVVVCVPPSGASFSLGTTTVTCTATDSGGAMASCSFTITLWDVCIKDEGTGDFLLFNSFTGDYLFRHCGPDTFTKTGRGTISRTGCKTRLEDDSRVIFAEYERCPLGTGNTGKANIKHLVPGTTFVLKDLYILNNNPNCP